ncbi:GTP-binding protein [Enterobacteriaceae endosymbiont of Macroplea appendiculata]|uniref:GTP-binding protein n=1 Tax=Enterobacteriaceae endosymbiont of Macroplea appendiculata TaxID=2675790 RepID=UPI001449953E|nr:GTP-binding protein [Enterobacteriaceae endosymbiont of Macroplea appendiculata]QJC30981.1 GTP-binding protein [Enterobacteriaceae endosymbiont of Macroplea appendiculata]
MEKIRNIAILAHVDHGKTTLIDKLLEESDSDHIHKSIFTTNKTRKMDTNVLEQEKGITIVSKQTAILWHNYTINIIDTPGHADLSSEVERILSMVDAFLLVVDAVEGPMPQTTFVTKKALEYKLQPIIIINKIDRNIHRSKWVLEQIFDLFITLDVTEQQLDFPIIYTSAIKGMSGYNLHNIKNNMNALYETIIKYTPVPKVHIHGPLQMQISQIIRDQYLGNICIGLIKRGTIKINDFFSVIREQKQKKIIKILSITQNIGLKQYYFNHMSAGNIIGISGLGLENINIFDTICDKNYHESLPLLTIDRPKINMYFHTNNSPLAGTEGKYITSIKLFKRIYQECLYNIALKIQTTEQNNIIKISSRGILQLLILIENIRREGYELLVSKPQIIEHIKNGKILEPFELLIIDIPKNIKGKIIAFIGLKGAIINNITLKKTNNRIIIESIISSRALIGFRTEFYNITSGTGIMNSSFSHYDNKKDNFNNKRNYGVLISYCTGYATAFALSRLQARGILFIKPGDKIYEGQIVGMHSKINDLIINCSNNKKLTNMRAAGKDNKIPLIPNKQISMEFAIDFINDDELIEITPLSIRLRKKVLKTYKNII